MPYMHHLKEINPKRKKSVVIEINSKVFPFGRQFNKQLYAFKGVSRRQCKFYLKNNMLYIFKSKNSQKIYVNGRKIKRDFVKLNNCDVISFGYPVHVNKGEFICRYYKDLDAVYSDTTEDISDQERSNYYAEEAKTVINLEENDEEVNKTKETLIDTNDELDNELSPLSPTNQN